MPRPSPKADSLSSRASSSYPTRTCPKKEGAADGAGVPTTQPVETPQPMNGAPTVKAVVAYAAKLRVAAAAATAASPWARPYAPSEAAARKLSQRVGPAAALQVLRARALEAERRDRERDRRSDASLDLLARRRERDDKARARRRARRTLGQRLDAALAELATVCAAPAARVGGDVVHGGEGDRTPAWVGDPSATARKIAHDAVLAVERELDHARRRELGSAA